MPDYALFLVIRTGLDYLWVTAAFCIALAAELAFPRGEIPSIQARYRVLTFAAVFFPLENIFSLVRAEVFQLEPLVAHPGGGVAGALLVGALYILIGDFIYYWYHRLQHAVPFLWRFHAIHHSVEQMVAGANYHHFMEGLFKAFLVAAPASLFFSSEDIVILATLIVFHGYYNHSGTSLNFGRLGRVILDNRVHRIHHSRDEIHFNKNFGGVTLIWDWLFGTAYFPARDEWPATGLNDQPEPQTMSDYLVRPFRLKAAPISMPSSQPR